MKCESLAYILHSRPFKDSSAILDCFTQTQGLISVVAKGAKRPRSPMRGLAQPFILLSLTWAGKSELKNLFALEAAHIAPKMHGHKILIGLYLNELLARLLHKMDPHPQLFEDYDQALTTLDNCNDEKMVQILLRRFELKLLNGLGYGLDLTRDIKLRTIVPELLYCYDPLQGFSESNAPYDNPDSVVSGASIIALQTGQFANDHQLLEAKKLMRTILAYHLGQKPLQSRQLFVQKV